ncbi:hypothetical protein Sjap_018265 [Stephania japonica]|uniref:Mediator-associated protein 2 n=1 Tax=Stephania japonica TaxID=461633 RepID=A0AAP0I7T3_9MAGN
MGSLEERYTPASEFQEDHKDPLLDISPTDSKELWLIQWPINQVPDFDGQEVTLKLKENGTLGSFESSSGTSYDVVSYASQDPDATVFLSSKSDSKIVGKISRRVSLVHYPEPSELEKQMKTNSRQMRPSGTLSANFSRYTDPTQGRRQRSRHSGSQMSLSTLTPAHSGRTRSSLFGSGQPSQSSKKIKTEEQTKSVDRSTHNSDGRGPSDVTFGSVGTSHQVKSKTKDGM